MLDFLVAKKTYIVAFLGAALVFAQQMGVPVPSYVLEVLGFLGIGTLRHGITTEAAKAVDAAAKRP